MMTIYVKLIGVSTSGAADEAEEPVAQETRSPMAVNLPEGATVEQLLSHMSRLGAATDEIQMVLVNGTKTESEARLKDNDAVVFIGQVAGE